jgi:LmbE family N-acetylglucosaminyl deacetylase
MPCRLTHTLCHLRHHPKLAASLLLATLAVAPVPAVAETPEAVDAVRLELLLRKLNTLGSVLYVAAHPDDENTALLAWLARERGVATAYLSLTRGDGGQNLVGSEQGDLLGVIRTQELLAARRIDDASQFFTRAIDFGFSKSAEETLAVWDREAVLGDLVWVVRRFRPDVIVTRFPTTGEGGHGHHTASAILTEEAFRAAGDASRFPEQLSWVTPWQARRLLWNRFQWPGQGAPPPDADALIKIDLGTYNPLLGRSYTEIAAESRSQHKSQGFGAMERRGTFFNWLDPCAGDAARSDLLEGIDLTWARVPGGAAAGAALARALAEFDPRHPAASLPALLAARAELGRLERGHWVDLKSAELDQAIRGAAGMWLEVIAEVPAATPGGKVKLTATAINRSPFPFALDTIALRFDGSEREVGVPLAAAPLSLLDNQPVTTDATIDLPPDLPYTEPYWLALAPERGVHRIPDPTLAGLPVGPTAVRARLTLTAGPPPAQALAYEVPVVFRRTDPVEGELRRPLEVVPPATLDLDRKVYVFPEAAARTVTVKVRSAVPDLKGTLCLRVPAGFTVAPAAVPVALAGKDAEAAFAFTVTPPASAASGRVFAELDTPGGVMGKSRVTIAYPHIPPQTLFPDAAATVVRTPLRRAGSSIGYVMGAGDQVPAALEQAGYTVSLLADGDLERGDLSRFDAIVTGVRAYNTRERLRPLQARLLAYVERGGTLVVQYNTDRGLVVDGIGPYPLKLSRDRVTAEGAAVDFLAPAHRLLNFPNRIGPEDFAGWVQERGLYFAGEWDPRYETVIACHDPGEKPLAGGLLVARHGKGAFVYTGYSWFRQLPAGVPGAYRIFANLLAAGKAE